MPGAHLRLKAGSCFYGRRGRNRTCNHRIRNPVLYPIELRAPFTINSLQCGPREVCINQRSIVFVFSSPHKCWIDSEAVNESFTAGQKG